MTFNEGADVSGNRARRRGPGKGVAIGGGAVGLGAIAVLILSLVTGQDFSGLLGGGTGEAPSSGGDSGTVIENCDTGADANQNDDCRIAAASLSLDQFWEEQMNGYRTPGLIVVDGSTSTACGTASNQTGPFYCPADETVYIDPTFFAILRDRFDATAGPLSQLYVLAHEYGHHIQNIAGTMDDHPSNGTGADSNGVRLELQADCFAGGWVRSMTEQLDPDGDPYLKAPTDQQIADALNAAETVGDDHIQSSSGGVVNPDSFTHGSSEQRQRWFDIGYREGIGSCDTFEVDGNQL